MTKNKIEPDRILVNFLRVNLTDVNPSRSGNWIYPDFPRVASLGNAQFPRVGVTILSETAEYMGIFDDTQLHTLLLQIDVVAKKDIGINYTVTDEAIGSISSGVNSNRLTYNFVPNTVTNIKHDGTSYGTVTEVTTDESFTTPGSLSADTVEFSYATGALNFSSADVSSHDGEAITSTYVVKLEGKKAAQHLARQIWKEIRNNWRADLQPRGLFYPELLGNNPIPIDEELGLYRQSMEIKVKIFNVGEGI